MNIKPAPFCLTERIVAATLGDRPADPKRVVRVAVCRTRLADEVPAAHLADVSGLLRPDCTPAVFPRPSSERDGRIEPPRVAPKMAATSAPVEVPLPRPAGQTFRREKIALPPLTDPRSKIVVRPSKPMPRLMADIRREQIAAAIAFLKQRGILVTVCDREAEIRRYRVTGKQFAQLHEEVIEIAVALGFEVPA